MKILIAPDSFKGCATAKEVAEALSEGIKTGFPEACCQLVPMADGGEGTVQSLVDATGGKLLEHEVSDPLGRSIIACYGILGDGETAVIEMASASGLPLIDDNERNPMVATTFGTGELIKAGLDAGCQKFIVGIGGSATNDGGVGMAKALGVRFLDENDDDIGSGGGALSKLRNIDVSQALIQGQDLDVVVACDVDNPLCGERGASAVYGPQKGATPEMVADLDANLEQFAAVVKRDLGKNVKDVSGAGAAGGLGAGLMAFLDASLRSGVDIVMDAVKLDESVRNADVVVTGEGAMDFQTAFNKAPIGVARCAKKHGLPVIAVAGTVSADAYNVYDHGIDVVLSIVVRPMELADALRDASQLIRRTGEQIGRLLGLNVKLRSRN